MKQRSIFLLLCAVLTVCLLSGCSQEQPPATTAGAVLETTQPTVTETVPETTQPTVAETVPETTAPETVPPTTQLPSDSAPRCSICKDTLTEDEANSYDGTRCADCVVCKYCGEHVSKTDFYACGGYSCYYPCYWERAHGGDRCPKCGELIGGAGAFDGVCGDCYFDTQPAKFCKDCGVELQGMEKEGDNCFSCRIAVPAGTCSSCWEKIKESSPDDTLCLRCYNASIGTPLYCDSCGKQTALEDFEGDICTDCYYDELYKPTICLNCGKESPWDQSVRGYCADCYDSLEAACAYCGEVKPISWLRDGACYDCRDSVTITCSVCGNTDSLGWSKDGKCRNCK